MPARRVARPLCIVAGLAVASAVTLPRCRAIEPVEVLARFEILAPGTREVLGASVLARSTAAPATAIVEDLELAMGSTRGQLRATLRREGPDRLRYTARRQVDRVVDELELDLAAGTAQRWQRRGVAVERQQVASRAGATLEDPVPFGQGGTGGLACWWDLVQQLPPALEREHRLEIFALRLGRSIPLRLSPRALEQVLVDGRPRLARRLFAWTASTGHSLWRDAEDGSLLALEIGSGGLARRAGVELPAPTSPRPPGTVVERPLEVAVDDLRLAGTLSSPAAVSTPRPGLLLVHGSGPIDRDGGTPGHPLGTYRDLAWALGQAGVAVLRYDKRGAGASASGDTAPTLQRLRDDAEATLQALASQPEVDATCVFALGHSEGGYIAPDLGRGPARLAGAILLAGPARPLGEVLVEQLRGVLASTGSDEAEIAQAAAQQQATFKVLRTRAPTRSTPAASPADERAAWLRSHLVHDSAGVLRALPAPVLALYGELDLQVPPSVAERTTLEQARAGLPLAVEVLPGLDHLFMPVDGAPGLGRYADPDRRISPQVADHIAAWLAAQGCVQRAGGVQVGPSAQVNSSASSPSE